MLRAHPGLGQPVRGAECSSDRSGGRGAIESGITHMGLRRFSLIDVTETSATFFAIFDLFLGISAAWRWPCFAWNH